MIKSLKPPWAICQVSVGNKQTNKQKDLCAKNLGFVLKVKSSCYII